jgi:SSS family solute:Na+ symporter
LFNQRINSRGAVWGLSLGFVLGMAKLVIQGIFGAGKVENPAFLAAIADFNFLYFSGVLFLISVTTIIAASYTAAAPRVEQLQGLTYASMDRKAIRDSWDQRDVIATAVILGLVVLIYGYFSFWI